MADGLTPLTRRLAAAVLSLRARALYWLLAGCIATASTGFTALILWARQDSKPPSSVAFPGTAGPEATIGGVSGDGDVAPEQARSVSIYPSPAKRSQPQPGVPLPEAERVVLYSGFTADHLRWLAAQPKLTTLSVLMTDDQSLSDLSPLSASSSLRWLRVLGTAGESTSEPLAWPPNLEVADLQDARPLALARLAELSRLPHLRTLAVRLHPGPPSSELPADVMVTLKSFPALRRLYLQTDAFPGLVRETQRSLPGVIVRPATSDSRRPLWVPAACFFLSLWAMIPALALSAQFVAPSSVLLPGYRVPHATVSGGFFALGLATTSGLLRFGGVDWLAAGGLCGGVVTLVLVFPVLFRRLDPLGMPAVMLILVPLQAFFWPTTVVRLFGRGELDWFLRGERPWLSAALMITGALAVAYNAWWLTSAYRRLEEYGRGGSPLGLDLAKWQAWAATTSQYRRPVALEGRLTAFDRRMHVAESSAPGDAAGRRRLWAAGAQVPPLVAMAAAVILCGLSFASWAVMEYFGGDFPQIDRQMLAAGLAVTLAVMVCASTLTFGMRRQFYSMEVLWPVSRTDWIRDSFVMSVADLAIPILLAAAGLCAGWWFSIWPITSASALPLGVIVVGAALTFRAAELWQRTYKPDPVVMVVCVICGAITGVAGSLWWVLGPGATAVAVFEWLSRPAGLWTLALGTVLLAAGVMYGAHRRWLRWELAA